MQSGFASWHKPDRHAALQEPAYKIARAPASELLAIKMIRLFNVAWSTYFVP
jgi:hypothetical protein